MAEAARDPRETITPDAFSVAPELLGTPLARPWRRGVAMAIDLVLIAIISGIGGWFFLGLGVAFMFFRGATRSAPDGRRPRTRLAMLGSLGTLTLVVTLWGRGCFESFVPTGSEIAREVVESSLGDVADQPGVGEAAGTVFGLIALMTADSESELQEAAQGFAEDLQGLGTPPAEIRSALDSIAAGREEPWALGAVRAGYEAAGIGPGEEVPSEDPDSLAIAYASALQADDSMAVAALRRPLVEAMAAGRIAELEERNRSLADRNEDLEEDLDQEESRGLINLILKVLNEVGIEFGWTALYFTLFPTLWRGRTPGKRLLGVRIVRLDGKPLGWWAALNRFGGYAASIFTGLLGFFEMFWDDNRQALQDRIASTVVVRETRPSKP
jgi:uncharacterized RDD family membrane protein YckC